MRLAKFKLKHVIGVGVGIVGGAIGFALGGPGGAAIGFALGSQTGHQAYSTYAQDKANNAALREQQYANEMTAAELERQRRRTIEQQKRENEQLMNSISNLTNTSFGGVSSPSVDYDKYGDLG